MVRASEPVGTAELDRSRRLSLRYFNFYRLLLATLFMVVGGALDPGQPLRPFLWLAVAYWILAAVIAFKTATRSSPAAAAVGWQVAVDIVVLAFFMYATGSYRGEVPFLMMTTIAGASLVGQGRMVLGAAALATIAVLSEQFSRAFILGVDGVNLPRAAIIGVGFFAVALAGRMLARRALANEALASRRGVDLERQMRVNARIIEDMQDGVIVIDRHGAVRLANPRVAELTGLEMRPGESLADHSRALQAAVTAGEPVVRLALDGKSRALNIRCVSVGNGRDTLLYLEDYERIQDHAQQLKLAALGRLTANIAHEIRNPLSSITHAGDLLQDEKRAAMQQRLVRIIRDNAARIERMVRDVLELGRRDRALLEPIRLAQFLHSFVEEFTLNSGKDAAIIALDIADACEIAFDRVHLYQIMSNLAANACRYCSGQPASIRISAVPIDEARIALSIRDDGPGIPKDDHMKVFEPFFTSDPKGTGLGLYMARELAEANGGSLRLLDTDVGATFELTARRAA